MNTVSLQITLPADIYNSIIKQSYGLNINDYILETIKQKLGNIANSFDDNLVEGYKASSLEDISITSDFACSDIENWD